MQALCGLQGIFDLFNCKTPADNAEKRGKPLRNTVKVCYNLFFDS